jgi:hypothetical protein
MGERRNTNRRNFGYYMQVVDDRTQELVGHLADISPRGFKLDSPHVVPTGNDFRLRLSLTSDVASKSYMVFIANSRWCKPDPLDPTAYNIGFEIKNIAPDDNQIFQQIVEKYGSQGNR